MAHEIWDNDNFLAVRQPGWHGLGVTLEDYPTRAEAQALAHPWEPITEPVYLAEPGFESPIEGFQPEPTTHYRQAEGFQAVRRSDDASLLGIVGDGYTPVKNDELWDIAEALQSESDDVMFETAGSLQGGRKVWVLVRLADPISVKGDPNGATLPYFALQNSHNGSGAFRGQATMTRIVCANTSQIADQESKVRGTEFSFRHTMNVGDRIEEAREALAGWRHSIDEWQALTQHMLTLQVDPYDFLDRWIPEPAMGHASERVLRNVEQARAQWFSAYDSETCEGIRGTAQGMFAASTEYAEHIRKAQSRESAFRRTYLDSNKAVKTAQHLAMELAR